MQLMKHFSYVSLNSSQTIFIHSIFIFKEFGSYPKMKMILKISNIPLSESFTTFFVLTTEEVFSKMM